MAHLGSDFRVTFAGMDRSALLTPAELGELIGKSANAVYHMLCRESAGLPTPVFRQHRYVRWRVGDVKDWIEGLPIAAPDDSNDVARRGRPRHAAGSRRDQ